MAILGLACPVPATACAGGFVQAGAGGGKVKFHSDERQVRRCQATYLVSQGYARLSAREFRSPEGPVLVLSKRPGTPIRTGKGEKGTGGRPMANAHTVVGW